MAWPAAVLESYFPGFGDLVLHREVVTPLDIEQVVGLSEGNFSRVSFLHRRCTSSALHQAGISIARRSRVTINVVREPIRVAA